MFKRGKMAVICLFLLLGLLNVSIPLGTESSDAGLFPRVSGESTNILPVVEVVPDVSSGRVPLTVSFNGEVYDGEIILLEWDFEGDGVFEIKKSLQGLNDSLRVAVLKSELQKEYTYTKPGIFHALLRVTDDTGGSAVSSVTVQVYSDVPRLDVVPCNKKDFEYMAQAGYEAFFSEIKKGIQFQKDDA